MHPRSARGVTSRRHGSSPRFKKDEQDDQAPLSKKQKKRLHEQEVEAEAKKLKRRRDRVVVGRGWGARHGPVYLVAPVAKYSYVDGNTHTHLVSMQ